MADNTVAGLNMMGAEGAKLMVKFTKDLAQKCPNTKVILGGYRLVKSLW